MINRNISEKIASLGFLFTCLVVSIHCYGKTDWFSRGDAIPIMEVIPILMSCTVSWCAVPFFLVVSGFLLFKDIYVYEDWTQWYKTVLIKRIRSLLVPYILWNSIYLALGLLTGKYNFNDYNANLVSIIGWPVGGALPCGQFWYIRCLLVYCIFAPAFFFLFKSATVGFACLVGLFVSWVCGYSGIGHQVLDTQVIMMFSLGVYVQLHYDKVTVCLHKWRCLIKPASVVILVVSIIAKIVCIYTNNPIGFDLATKFTLIGGLIAAWLYCDSLVSKILGRFRRLWGYSFLIYAMHPILISIISKLLYSSTVIGEDSLIRYFACLGLGILGPILIGNLSGKHCLSLYNLLTGGRR